jgi:hypothetical protein
MRALQHFAISIPLVFHKGRNPWHLAYGLFHFWGRTAQFEVLKGCRRSSFRLGGQEKLLKLLEAGGCCLGVKILWDLTLQELLLKFYWSAYARTRPLKCL